MLCNKQSYISPLLLLLKKAVLCTFNYSFNYFNEQRGLADMVVYHLRTITYELGMTRFLSSTQEEHFQKQSVRENVYLCTLVY